MPKRVIDFDAMWGSDKLAACADWAQAEYAWLYGLADASGCFELTNLRVIWGRVAAIRGNLTIERLEQVFAEFQDKGLLFVWEHEGKRYAHWTGSDVPGRLPPPSWRMRLERFAPAVPKQQFAEYMGRFARGRAALAGVGFRGEAPRETRGQKEDLKYEKSKWGEERRTTGRAGNSQGDVQRRAGEDRGDDLKFEISDLREESVRGGCAPNSQLSDPRLLIADRVADCEIGNSDLRRTEERSGNSRGGERLAAGAARGREGMGREVRNAGGWSGIKECIEGAQAQDLGLDWNLNGNWNVGKEVERGESGESTQCPGGAERDREMGKTHSFSLNSKSKSNSNSESNSNADSESHSKTNADSQFHAKSNFNSNSSFHSRSKVNVYSQGMSPKELAVQRELRVGAGPVCGPKGVKPEVLERIRKREEERAASRGR